jgi:hypothetical protein
MCPGAQAPLRGQQTRILVRFPASLQSKDAEIDNNFLKIKQYFGNPLTG